MVECPVNEDQDGLGYQRVSSPTGVNGSAPHAITVAQVAARVRNGARDAVRPRTYRSTTSTGEKATIALLIGCLFVYPVITKLSRRGGKS